MPFSSPNVMSQSVTYAVPPSRGFLGSNLGGIAEAAQALIQRATYDPEKDPKVQQAAYYKAEAANVTQKTTHAQAADSVLTQAMQEAADAYKSGATDATPLLNMIAKTAPYVQDWDHYKGLMSQFISTIPAVANNPVLKNTFVMSLGGIDKDKDITATDHASRVAEEAALARQKVEYEHGDRVLNINTDASVQMRGQNISSSDQRRGQDLSASTSRRGQDMTDARERSPIQTTVQQITQPAQTTKVGGFLGFGGHKETTPQTRTTTTTKTRPPAGGAPAAAAPAAAKSALPPGISKEAAVAQAKQAVAQGRDKAGVAAKLRGWGINPAEAGL